MVPSGFIYLDSAISRADYIKKLENEIRRFDGYENFGYKKNAPGIYEMLQKIGNETQAKLRAAKLRSLFDNAHDFKSHKPCTCVDILVEDLEHPENLLEGM